MPATNRSPWLLGFIFLAASCGSVTTPPADASADKGGGAGTGGGTAGTSGSAGVGAGGAGQGGAGGQAGGGGVCATSCSTGRMCCGGACVNLNNDPMNCGTCGKACEGSTNLCSDGTCVAPPCSASPGACTGSDFCCGSACCKAGQLCCQADGPVGGLPPTCFTPTVEQKTCAQGCAPLCISDRYQKKNLAPVDAAAILDKVSGLPISTWTYQKEPDEVRHLGPMAQDFRAAFGLGDDDRTYYAVDAQGVALAAIKALNQQLTAQAARIDKLERENRALARRLRDTGTERR